jgi:hypothetical protein
VECPENVVPVEMRQTGMIEGPGKTVPVRGLVLGLLKGLEKQYQLEG